MLRSHDDASSFGADWEQGQFTTLSAGDQGRQFKIDSTGAPPTTESMGPLVHQGAWCGASFTAGGDDWREDKSMVVEVLEATMLVDVLEASGDLNIPVAHHSACHDQLRQAACS